MDPKHLHDTRKKLNDLAISHNRLTTLTACLLNEVQSLRKEVNELKGIKTIPEVPQHHMNSSHSQQQQQRTTSQQSHRSGGAGMGGRQQQSNQFRYDPNNIASLKADEILQQLHLGHD